MALSDALRSAWAKHDQKTDSWLPLLSHVNDTAAVAGRLWDHWVADALRRAVADAVGSDEGARALYVFLAAAHDCGKISPAFAVQVPSLALRMGDAGLQTPLTLPDRQHVRHELVSQLALGDWLEAHGWSRPTAETYAAVLGGHHGNPPSPGALVSARPRTQLVGSGAWSLARRELLDHVAARSGAGSHLADWALRPLSRPAQALLSAAVIVADWMASDADLHPYGPPAPDRADAAWERLAVPPPWRPSPPPPVEELFAQRFALPAGSAPRPVQRAAVRSAAAMDGPGLVVVEAEMGSGKTEAALAAAEVLAHRFGAGGVFVALPTMATSDAMFARVLRWARRLPADGGEGQSIFLAHGKAALNADFTTATWRGAPSQVAPDDDARLASVTAHEWFRGRRKGVLANLVVGTIDQVLFAALQAKHLALRHLALATKVVVIDEVHSSDAYSRSYLERVLHWLGGYGTPVVLLSATLPAAQRLSLLQAYDSGRAAALGRRHVWAAEAPSRDYPVVTTVSAGRVTATPVPSSGSGRQVTLVPLDDGDDALVALLQRELADGGCAGVIRNTVKRAQQTAALLRRSFGEDVELYHSRYVAPDRAARESSLVARLGPPGGDGRRPERVVVVGTQVMEQSLDLDFDVMVTDLAPVDLVLQRLGRLHRHERGVVQGERPAGLRAARCYVAGVEDWTASPPVLPRGSATVYGTSRLLRSVLALDGHLAGEALRLPEDIPTLVEVAYDPGPRAPEAWGGALAAADAAHEQRVADQLRRADTFRLAEIRHRPTINGWTDSTVGDDAYGAAHVRDTEDTLEVVVVQRADGGVRLLPWTTPLGGAAIETDWPPPDDVARAAASCTLRLPLDLTRGRTGDVLRHLEAEHFPGWQQTWWLRGQLVLVLDEALTARLPDRALRYDRDDGLVITRTAPEGS